MHSNNATTTTTTHPHCPPPSLHLPHANDNNDAYVYASSSHTSGDDHDDNTNITTSSTTPSHATILTLLHTQQWQHPHASHPCPERAQKQQYNAHHHACCAIACVALTSALPPCSYPTNIHTAGMGTKLGTCDQPISTAQVQTYHQYGHGLVSDTWGYIHGEP